MKVEIVGDSKSLEQALGRSSAATSRWGGAVQKAGRYAGFAGLAIGGALVVGLTKATKGAIEDEAAQARLAQAFKQSNVPIQNYSKAIDRAEAAGVKLGFTDDAVVESLGSLVIATHDGRKAIDLLSVAEDIARFKHLDLAGASKILTMAMAGSQRATKQLGLSLQPTTENVDALKAAAKANKTEVDGMALAQAKAADKMQTSQNVIALVTQKLKGQSEAFSQTAAGGIEQLRASLDRLGDTIGAALLPALTKVIGPLSTFFAYLAENPKLAEGLVIGIAALAGALLALSVAASAASSIGVLAAVFAAISLPIAAVVVAVVALGGAIAAAVLWPDKLQAALQRMGLSAEDSRKTVEALRNAFTAIKAVVQTVWPAIQAIIVPALQVIKGLLMIVSGILRGDFSDAWKGIKIVVGNEIKFVTAILTAFPRVVLGVATQIGSAIAQGIGNGLRALPGVVRRGLASISGAIADVAAQAPGWAAGIGRAIIQGVVNGLDGLYGAVKDKIEGILGSVLSHINIPGFSPPEQAAKKAIADPIVKGGSDVSGLGSAMSKKLAEELRQAMDSVRSARESFASAWADLASQAIAAFDAKMSTWRPAAQITLDRMQLQDQIDSLNKAIVEAGGTAVTGPTLAAKIKANQAAMRDALLAGQDELAVAYRAKLEFLYGQQAQVQQAAHDKQVAQDKVNFQDRFNKIQADAKRFAESGGKMTEAEAANIRKRTSDLLQDMGLNAKFWGTAIGISLAQGLQQAQGAVRKAALALANAVAKLLKTKSPTEEGPMADLDMWWSGFAETLVSGLHPEVVLAAGQRMANSVKAGWEQGLGKIDWWGALPEGLGQSILDSIAGVTPQDAAPATEAISGVTDTLTTATSSVDTFGAAMEALPSRAQTAFTRLVELVTKALAPLPAILAPAALALLGIADAILAIGGASYQARAALRDTAGDIARLLQEIAAAGSRFRPFAGRQSGGRVIKDRPYIVGEAGPELFIPSSSGYVAANGSSAMHAAGGQTVIALNFYGPAVGSDRQFQDLVRRALYDVSRRNPGTGLALA